MREILGRTRRARAAQPGETARLFRLSASSQAGRAVGRLEIVAMDGTSTVREVTGKTCGEVLDALALVARIAIDPDQALDDRDAPGPETPQDARARDARRERGPLDRPAEKDDTPRERPASSGDDVEKSRATWRFRFGMGAHASATTLVSPSVTPGFGVFADWAGEPPTWLGLRAGLRLAASGEIQTGAGTARFLLMGGRLGACVPRLQLSNPWSVCPIAGIEVGVLNARGTETSGARSAYRPWFALGAGLRLEWRVTAELFAELEGEGSAPVVRDRFVFDEPKTTVHEPAAVGANAAIGLGYRFR
jgi:hypothetical protein